ncbi:hypothetical protein [Amycolatopsis sp. CA-126428]|uniref:hypothetical protein n=1 Tax=Amycolatopsis sp. CA-126428 TaxID=2073158 RepID=UPI000CD00926|nr:hypothetical protein [Amycolatopsis sp. CA-126428]
MSSLTRRGFLGATAAGALLGLLPTSALASSPTPVHPRLYIDAADKDALLAKLGGSDWAKASLAAIKARIDPLADRHTADPAWILSRMSMFWTDGARYTQIYVAKQNFDRGTGNAPVPTVRPDATRGWNSNVLGPLETRLPYSADGSQRNNQGQVVPYAQTGHMHRLNNQEILSLAQQAGFLHWVTGDEKYAKLGADIYWQWLLGTYYMNPMLDPASSLGGPGGYAPGGIGGYYDYEVIHDPMGGQAAVVYDFLFDYLVAHPDPHAVSIGKSVIELSTVVFKRFIEIGLVRGGATGNWNVNGWSCILTAILALEPNAAQPDGKGSEYYLQGYTTTSTQYHQALPDLLKEYDPVTGLWHESPMYSFGTISVLVDLALPVRRAGVDTIGGNDIMRRAALAIGPWLDPRGNMVVFGDGRGGSPGYVAFERLAAYYTQVGDTEGLANAVEVLRNAIAAGQYTRNTLSFVDLIDAVDLPSGTTTTSNVRTAYSAHHRHLTLKNRNDVATGLMATLYGGVASTDHLNPNGLALQLYGQGWALSPNTKSYESYWSADYPYSKGPAGANTIVPGYTSGPIQVNAVEPPTAPDAFTNAAEISANHQFADMTAAEKRRQVAIVRTSATTGYYVDVFRSDQASNDYIHHNLGNSLTLSDSAGGALPLAAATDLGTADAAYKFFSNVRSVPYTGDISARWKIDATDGSPEIGMEMWMLGQPGRTIYQADGLPTTVLPSVVPHGVNMSPQPTPTLIVRQTGANAASAPFVSVFEPTTGGNRSIRSIRDLGSSGTFAGIVVSSEGASADLTGRVDHVLSATDDVPHAPSPLIDFTGLFGVATWTCRGFRSLYLGSGRDLRLGDYRISAGAAVSAGLDRTGETVTYSASAPITLTLPRPRSLHGQDIRIEYKNGTRWFSLPSVVDRPTSTVSATVPAGYAIEVRVVGRHDR